MPQPTLVLRIVTGARAGQVFTTDAAVIRVGRGPHSELRFDPDSDRVVSSEHAVITRAASSYRLRDESSRNGTFLNGTRITGDVELRDHDRITLGEGGPEVEVRIVQSARSVEDAVGAAGIGSTDRADAPVRLGAGHANVGWKRAAYVLALGACLVAAGVFVQAGRERREWEQQRSVMLARIDSAMAGGEQAIASLQGELQGLASALRTSQQQVRGTVAQLEQALRRGRSDSIAVLQQRLELALSALSRQQAVAGIDHGAIRERNGRAVARIFVEYENGVVATGTAFAVRRDGMLVTARHVLLPDSTPLRRVAVQFSYSDQVWPARVVAIDSATDLAVVKVDAILGDVPVVAAFNLDADTLSIGAPAVLIGYPLGGESMASERPGRTLIRPVIGVGVVTAVNRGTIELQAYAAGGTSGSPVFDATGALLGVAFGGWSESGVHHVMATSGAAIARLVAGVSRR